MTAMGFVGDKNDLGCEAAGIIRSVGPGPHHQGFQVGDRVLLFGTLSFCTSIVTESIRCYKVPAGLSLGEAATIPCVYLTVMHSLVNIGSLERGNVCIPYF